MPRIEPPILREMRLKNEAFEKASDVLKKVLGSDCPDIVQDNWLFTKRVEQDEQHSRQEVQHSWLMIEKEPDTPFSDELFEEFIPRKPTQIGFHFCGLPALKSMCQSGQIWLTQLSKRVSEDEIKEFARTHEMLGLKDDEDINETARDLFYASFTTSDNYSDTMWSDFGPVRLQLEITPVQHRSELRPIAYLENCTQTRLADVIREMRAINVFFTPRTISRLCAFGLPKKEFQHEQEIRLLVKRYRWGDKVSSPQYFVEAVNLGFDVCPIHLLGPNDDEASELCNIRLLGITVRTEETKREVDAVLQNCKYKTIGVQKI